MDETTFAHLRPKQRGEDYAARVREFIEKCPVDEENAHWRNSAYWQIVRSSQVIAFIPKHRARWQTEKDAYRVLTKMRRVEVKYIVFFLPFVEFYSNVELEADRDRLLDEGRELIGIYDAIIEACS